MCQWYCYAENAEGFEGYNTLDDKMHQAGYDAYITGICYLGLSQYLGKCLQTIFYLFVNHFFVTHRQTAVTAVYLRLCTVDIITL